MATELRTRGCQSWMDARWARVFARELADRLIARCKGRTGLCLTLTYRREDWESPRHLWRMQSEQQHVALFMRRLGRALDRDLTGKYLAKAEFQEGGWVHFHVVLLDVDYIEHALLERAWGHGFVWVNRITRRRLRYVCKYVSKDGELPAFLLGERRVRIVRASMGFWGDSRKRRTRDDDDGPSPDVIGAGKSMNDVMYISVGERIRRAELQVIARDDQGCYRTLRVPLYEVLTFCQQRGVSILNGGRWLRLGVALDLVSRWAGQLAGGLSREAASPPGLHSIGVGKRDEWGWVGDLLAERLRGVS